MSKTYDDILRNKIEGMESTPPDGLWSQIEKNIPSGSVEAFDNAIKSKLDNIAAAPPPSVWSRIAAVLNSAIIPFYKTLFFKRIAAVLFIIATAVSIIWFTENKTNNIYREKESSVNQINNLPQENPSNLPVNNSKPTSSTASQVIKNDVVQPIITDETIAGEPARVETPVRNLEVSRLENQNHFDRQIINSTDDKATISINSQRLPLFIENSVALNPKVDNFAATESNLEKAKADETVSRISTSRKVEVELAKNNTTLDTTNKRTELNEKSNEVVEQNISEVITENQEAINPGSNGIDPILLPKNPRNINKLGLSLHYIPVALNTSVTRISQNDFNISLSYQNINFTSSIGLGIGFSSEAAEYQIDYTRNEFVKIQFITDSLGFTYDASTQTYTPVPFGHYEKVYDDVKYSFSAEAITRNTWFNIPINFGYIKDYRKFSLIAGGGLNYSMIISRKVIGLFEPDNQSTINKIYYPVQTRITSNISYNLNAGIAYKLRESLSLSGELYGLYYQNPLYENIKTRTYGFGVRFGLTYFFE